MNGLIALDIDGTITVPGEKIPIEVINYLKRLSDENWGILFITGRSFHGTELLNVFSFPYHLAVQNGAIILEMPSKRVISRKYLDKSIISAMHAICEGEPTDFVIYGGCENLDISYYRPQNFSDELREYVTGRAKAFKETWRAVQSFEEVDIDEFPSIKCFGLHKPAIKVANQIEAQLGLHVPVIRDPYNEEYYVAQATHKDVSKGQALMDMMRILNYTGATIAAGDDYNDCTMLEAADIKVVMATAPGDMLLKADIIAPPASKKGIIAGLQAAIVCARKSQ